MVRPGRERLTGLVEVDETYWGAEEEGVIGRQTERKALIAVAAEEIGTGLGRIRMKRVSAASLMPSSRSRSSRAAWLLPTTGRATTTSEYHPINNRRSVLQLLAEW